MNQDGWEGEELSTKCELQEAILYDRPYEFGTSEDQKYHAEPVQRE